VPLDCNERTKGDQLFEVSLPEGCCDFNFYEIVEDPPLGTYREWCIPAEVINRHGTVRLLLEEKKEAAEEKAARARFRVASLNNDTCYSRPSH
jgi:hypothetical protein